MGSGMELHALWSDVRANQDRLDSCMYHDFDAVEAEVGALLKPCKCRNCGGELSYSNRLWYEKGLVMARARMLEESNAK